MANTPSARKRARQAEPRRLRNVSLKSRLRTHIKNVIKAVEQGDRGLAETAYKAAVPVIDSSVNKKLLHRNKAARQKSRLNARIKVM